jgi:hypothetical protein
VASRARHVEQARHKRRIAEQLLATWPTDEYAAQWAIVAAFYAAVHCAEAFLDDLGLHSLDHDDRERLLADHNVGFPEDARDAYDQLKQWSTHARYGLRTFRADYVRAFALGVSLLTIETAAGL